MGFKRESADDRTYTAVPNEFFILVQYLDTVAEVKVLAHIIRQTYGWHKESDEIALSQFHEHTGLLKQSILDAINTLEAKGIIVVDRSRATHRYSVKYQEKRPGLGLV